MLDKSDEMQQVLKASQAMDFTVNFYIKLIYHSIPFYGVKFRYFCDIQKIKFDCAFKLLVF